MSGLGLGLERTVVDADARRRSIKTLKSAGVRLPTWSELRAPDSIDDHITKALLDIDPDEPNAKNLFRVHWFNDSSRRARAATPGYVLLPKSLTGIDSPIIALLGNRFPMIEAHKVLAAYGCLVPRLVTGQFDASAQRAIWPSTGNYCRGGVAISKVLGCRGVAVLPEGMSQERFDWLSRWTQDPSDVVRTVGTESNVKEIYDKCNELSGDPGNLIFNQFCEFGNHLIHYHCTGHAAELVFEAVAADTSGPLNLAAFVSATGSAGTIAAGDYLKDRYGSKIVAAEALECPTMLENGFGEHNIQGIGDKHIPYIHNVMNTDVVSAISDAATDSLFYLFGTDEGRGALSKRGMTDDQIAAMTNFGFSGICNVLSAIKTAKALGLGASDAVVTVATDGANLYTSENPKILSKRFGGKWSREAAEQTLDTYLGEPTTENLAVLGERDRNRIFNLGYYTWVEQQGVELDEFEKRRSQEFWVALRDLIPIWDRMIGEFNHDIEAVG